jgi:hypothetical protein
MTAASPVFAPATRLRSGAAPKGVE